MKRRLLTACLLALALCACGDDTDPDDDGGTGDTGTTDTGTTTDNEDRVEITLQDELDGVTNSFCLDIAGGNTDIDPSNGLQAHTCYSYQGQLGEDQVFDVTLIADNQLYMPDFNVCAQLASLEAGAEIGLAACDGGELQTIALTEDGLLQPVAAPEMCFTVSDESRFGRSDVHQIRDLSLEACSDALAARQQWRTRTMDD